MDTNNFLGGIGLFACIGGIILVALVALAARALTRGRTNAANNTNMWNNPGPEQPQYNDPNIQSQGGFGSVPNTGPENQQQGGVIGSSGLGGGAQTYNTDEGSEQSRKRPHDSDEINSSGGFGRG